MSDFKQTPASIRYLKARLSILKRPTVWGSAAAVLLSIFMVGEYLAHPEHYTGAENTDAAPPPSSMTNLPAQEGASASDVFETLPELANVPTQSSVEPKVGTQPNPSSSQSDSDPLLQEFLLGRSLNSPQNNDRQRRRSSSSAAASSSASTPSTSSSSRRSRSADTPLPNLYSPSLYSPTPSSGLASVKPGTSGSESLSSPPNPLQSALDRYSATPVPSSLSNLSDSGNGLRSGEAAGSGLAGSQSDLTPTQRPYSSQPYTGQPYMPQLSPSPGTTGYTLPSTLRSPNAIPSSSSGSSGSSTQPIPGQTAPLAPTVPVPSVPVQSYGSQPTQPPAGTAAPRINPVPQAVPPAAPYSVPRPVPGRNIGGGEINTFSNP